jgi:DNA-binding transcriptional ArsR family regulator
VIVSGDCDVETIGEVLSNPTTRTILRATSQEPMSARALSETCEVSQPTIYRKVETLRACGLLEEDTHLDPDGGHHRTVYQTDLERLIVLLEAGEFDLRIDRRADVADRFTDLIEGI